MRRSWGFLMVLAVVVVGALATLRALGHAREEARLASCRPVYLYELVSRFADDTDGLFPPLSPVPGRLMYDATFLANHADIVNDHYCDADPNPPEAALLDHSFDAWKNIDDWSYIYLGYVIENQSQLETFAAAYRRVIAEGGDFTGDLKVPPGEGNGGGDTIYRLRTQDELLKLVPSLEGRLSPLPVVLEWPGNHADDLVQYMCYGADRQTTGTFPGAWPITEEAMAVLRALDGLGDARP